MIDIAKIIFTGHAETLEFNVPNTDVTLESARTVTGSSVSKSLTILAAVGLAAGILVQTGPLAVTAPGSVTGPGSIRFSGYTTSGRVTFRPGSAIVFGDGDFGDTLAMPGVHLVNEVDDLQLVNLLAGELENHGGLTVSGSTQLDTLTSIAGSTALLNGSVLIESYDVLGDVEIGVSENTLLIESLTVGPTGVMFVSRPVDLKENHIDANGIFVVDGLLTLSGDNPDVISVGSDLPLELKLAKPESTEQTTAFVGVGDAMIEGNTGGIVKLVGSGTVSLTNRLRCYALDTSEFFGQIIDNGYEIFQTSVAIAADVRVIRAIHGAGV